MQSTPEVDHEPAEPMPERTSSSSDPRLGWACRLGHGRSGQTRRQCGICDAVVYGAALNPLGRALEMAASVWISSRRADASLDRTAAGKHVGSAKRRLVALR